MTKKVKRKNKRGVESKSFQKLRARLQFQKQHLQTVDIALVNAFKLLKSERDKNKKIAEALGHTTKKYTELNHPVHVNPRILNHSKSSNYQYTIIVLHSYFSEYLKGLLAEIYTHNPLRVVGNHNGTLDYKKLIELGTFEKIQTEMVSDVFRKLENQRSSQKLLDEILKKGNASVDENLKRRGLAYLEMRHLFIHAMGITDQNFVDSYGDIVAAKVGQRLPLGYPIVEAAIRSVQELCKEVDKQMIAGGFIRDR